MDNERIQEIRARADAATKGPWIYDSWQIQRKSTGKDLGWCVLAAPSSMLGLESKYPAINDGEFIANAREDIPWLLEQLAITQEMLDAAAAGQETLQRAFVEAERREQAAIKCIPHTCSFCSKNSRFERSMCQKRLSDGWHGATNPCGEFQFGDQQEDGEGKQNG